MPDLKSSLAALHTRLGMSLPQTQKLMESRRPMGTDNHSTGWER